MTYYRETALSMHKAAATVNTMTYDGDGQRQTKRTGSVTTTFVWDGSDYLGEVR